MARKLKPVDDTPICDPAYLRRIDPLWLVAPVPWRFWEDCSHRRDYLLWAAKRCGFRRMKDFYALDLLKVFRKYHGSGLKKYWGVLPLAALQDCFPQYDWKPWFLRTAPIGFWQSLANRRSYLDWLGKEMGFRRLEDWYRIQTQDLRRRRGGSLLNCYASLYDLMREFLPQLAWDRVDVHRPLKIKEILAWADEHFHRRGRWPTCYSGGVAGREETWVGIDACLVNGYRGLQGGSSLARFLEECRGVPSGKPPLRLSEEQVLAWADACFAAHGRWPNRNSGSIPGTRENWHAIEQALQNGNRGLRGNSSIAQLLARTRGTRNRKRLPRLLRQQILAWADAHFAAQGSWPTAKDGPIPGTCETWGNVADAMRRGSRGLRRRCSLPQFLATRRGARNRKRLPPLTERQILVWSREHFKAQLRWPTTTSGPIARSRGETWMAIEQALVKGLRGLPGGSSLAKLLRKHGMK